MFSLYNFIFQRLIWKEISVYFYGLIIEFSRNEKLQKYRIILSQHTYYLHKWLVHLNFDMFTAAMFILFLQDS